MYSFIDEVVSNMEADYEFNTSMRHGYGVTEEEEQKIYDMPYEEDQDHGPTFTNPPTEEQEIYEAFKGRNINILHHNDIR